MVMLMFGPLAPQAKDSTYKPQVVSEMSVYFCCCASTLETFALMKDVTGALLMEDSALSPSIKSSKSLLKVTISVKNANMVFMLKTSRYIPCVSLAVQLPQLVLSPVRRNFISG